VKVKSNNVMTFKTAFHTET